jgi:acetylornithine/N-succinyldiaminopimelate aminotransferase
LIKILVLLEGIWSVGGCHRAIAEFQKAIIEKCNEHGALYIHDSVPCGYGRSSDSFGFEASGVKPDIISMSKGMGNSFPIGGILISLKIDAKFSALGITFGGNHLACAAGIAVLDVIKEENLVQKAKEYGEYILAKRMALVANGKIKEVRDKEIMIGIDLEGSIREIREKLMFDDKIFIRVSGTNTIRLLPSLNRKKEELDRFLDVLGKYF